MTEDREQRTENLFNRKNSKKRARRFLSVICLLIPVFCLLSCVAVRPPPVQLPPREGIVPGESITVQGNQNVYGVARKYNVSMRELIVLNNIQPPFTLKSGQRLTLPANKQGGDSGSYSSSYASSGSSAPTPISAPSGSIQETTLPPIQNPSSPSSIQSAPLPPASNSILGAPVTSAPVEALNTPTAPPKPVATTVEPQHIATASPPPPIAESKSETPTSMVFAWPVQGPILSAYGPKGQGLSNDGINIAAPKGAPVLAAANGIVVYAGNEMKGFGNLVLIRHQHGWVTAYAHLDRALVSKDAVVAQGDMIGTVGKTGNVPTPQLHFETRYNGKPVDPSGVIKAQ